MLKFTLSVLLVSSILTSGAIYYLVDANIVTLAASNSASVHEVNSNNETEREHSEPHLFTKGESNVNSNDKPDPIKKQQAKPNQGRANKKLLTLIDDKSKRNANSILAALDSGYISPNENLKESEKFYTPLFLAMFVDKEFNVATLYEFIARGSQVHSNDLWVPAVSLKSPDVIQELISMGFDPNQKFTGFDLAQRAFLQRNFESVTRLMDLGFPLNNNVEFSGKKTSLKEIISDMEAGEEKDEMLEFLADFGSDT